MTLRRVAGKVLLIAGCMVAASEAAHSIAARGPHGAAPRTGCAVLVLGSPANDDGSASEEQRLRVEAGTEAARENGCELLVISGGAAHNPYKEAEVMAALVSGGAPFRVVRETEANNTWENIRRSLPLMQSHSRILIASDALHAQRGRRYLCKQRPALCASTEIAAAPRPWWRMPYRLGSSLYELRALVRDALF